MKTLDLTGLTDEEIQVVENLVEILKKRSNENKGISQDKSGEQELPVFNVFPLGVKGRLTRKEIYGND